jgi:hypothetical protein
MARLVFKKWWNKENIFLILDNGEFRSIWYMKNEKYYIKRDRNKHYFEYYKWYWYNKLLLDSLPWNTRLVLQEKWNPRLCYTAMVEDITKHNQTTKQEWYEPQYVYEKSKMELDLWSRQK